MINKEQELFTSSTIANIVNNIENEIEPVEKQSITKKPLTLNDYLNQETIIQRIKSAFTSNNDFSIEELISSVKLAIKGNDLLERCSFDSVLRCILDCAHLNLLPNKNLGYVHFIPIQDRATNQTLCNIFFGYKAYIKKIMEAGYSIDVELVTKEEIEQNRFSEIRGSETKIHHLPLRTGIRDRNNIQLGYAVASFPNKKDIVAVLTVEEFNEIAKETFFVKGEGKKTKLRKMWNNEDRATDYGEMCKKTLIKRLSKLLNTDKVNYLNARDDEYFNKLQNDICVNPKETVINPQTIDQLCKTLEETKLVNE